MLAWLFDQHESFDVLCGVATGLGIGAQVGIAMVALLVVTGFVTLAYNVWWLKRRMTTESSASVQDTV